MRRIATVLLTSAALLALTLSPAMASHRHRQRATERRSQRLINQIDRRATVQHAITPFWAVGDHLQISFNKWEQKRQVKRATRIQRRQMRNRRQIRRERRQRRHNHRYMRNTNNYGNAYNYSNNSRQTRNSYSNNSRQTVRTTTVTQTVIPNRTPGIPLRRW